MAYGSNHYGRCSVEVMANGWLCVIQDVIDITLSEDAGDTTGDTEDMTEEPMSEADFDDDDDESIRGLGVSLDSALLRNTTTLSNPSYQSAATPAGNSGSGASNTTGIGLNKQSLLATTKKIVPKRRPFVLARNRDRRNRTTLENERSEQQAAGGIAALGIDEELMSVVVVVPDHQSYTKKVAFLTNTSFLALRASIAHWWCWWFVDPYKYAFFVNGTRIDNEHQLLVQYNLHTQVCTWKCSKQASKQATVMMMVILTLN
jgi:hypothetical protein